MTESESENLQQYLPTGVIDLKPKTIEEGVLCPRCGYDLRGVKRGYPCPECGRLTRKLSSLQDAEDLDVDYVLRVRLGLRMLALSWMLTIPVPLISIFVPIEFHAVLGMQDVGLILLVGAIWMISSRSALNVAAGSKRSVVEYVALTAAIGGFIFTGSVHYQWWKSPIGAIAPVSYSLAFACLLVSHVVIAVMSQRLADLMHDEPLGRRFWALAWILAITGAIGVPIAAWMLGGVVFVACLGLLFFTLGFYIAEIVFLFSVWKLGSQFAWTAKYQHESGIRDERLRAERIRGQSRPS